MNTVRIGCMVGDGTSKIWPYKRYGLTTGLLWSMDMESSSAAATAIAAAAGKAPCLSVSVNKHFYHYVLDMGGSKT